MSDFSNDRRVHYIVYFHTGVTLTLLDTYNYFITLLNPGRYLCVDLPFLHKKATARFRCSSHKLKLETSRHQNIDRGNRYCPYCQTIENVFILENTQIDVKTCYCLGTLVELII